MNESIILCMKIACSLDMLIVTIDIVGAYLNAHMTHDVFMRFSPYETKILCELCPEYAGYVYNGFLYLLLLKALYGCIEAARLFFENLKTSLTKFGFVQHSYDPCVFIFSILVVQ